jgi:hypothetical protein
MARAQFCFRISVEGGAASEFAKRQLLLCAEDESSAVDWLAHLRARAPRSRRGAAPSVQIQGSPRAATRAVRESVNGARVRAALFQLGQLKKEADAEAARLSLSPANAGLEEGLEDSEEEEILRSIDSEQRRFIDETAALDIGSPPSLSQSLHIFTKTLAHADS